MRADRKKEEEEKINKIVPVEERIHPRRVIMAILFVIITAVYALVISWRGRLAPGGMICEMLLVMPMCLLFVIYLMRERRSKRLWYEDTDYVSLVALYSIACALLLVSAFFIPLWLSPVMAASFIISPFRDRTLSVTASLIMTMAYAYGYGANGRITVMFVCEVVLAVMISDVLIASDRRGKILLFVMITALQTLVSTSVRYFDRLRITDTEVVYALCLGAATGLSAVILMPLISRRVTGEKIYHYQTIIDNDYPLISEIKMFSQDEYERARKLSVISLKAAQTIGADPYLAAAGGMYYRVGLIRGDREVDCAMDIAAENGFPEQLTAILYEYQGIIRRPTSKESAIVHMCDAMMRRIDALSEQSDVTDSGWNKQMIIYQALNELSTAGTYDDSTITINQFLRIRDLLVREL